MLQVAPRRRLLSTVAVYSAGTRRLKYWYPTVMDFRMRYSRSAELVPISEEDFIEIADASSAIERRAGGRRWDGGRSDENEELR